MKGVLALGGCAFALVCLTPSAATASLERFAVVIGNNHGLASDETLQYAESDATRVFEVLRDLGGFQPVNMVLLRDEDADTVQRTLIAVNDRIRAAVSLPNGQAMLFVYYSGHADADDLHLGQTRLAVARLAQLARGSAANFRLVVLDACRSGALTRLKGGKILAPFELPGERVPEDGFAFLTASAANEDAQESDELRASFFTHAFVSGMLGPADRDANGEVALEEAYGYAYDATIRATSRTFGGTQHPAFRYDFRGQGSVVLTRPDAYSGQRANLHFPPKLNFLLMRGGADGPVVAELEEGAVQRSLSLRPGAYFVRARGRDVMYEGQLTAAPGASQSIQLDRLSRIEYARLVRKGRSDTRVVHSLELGGVGRSVLPNAETACFGASLGYALDFETFGGRARFNACHSSFENRVLMAATTAYDLDLRVYRAWDLSLVALEVGLGGGVSLFTGEYETRGVAPSSRSLAPFLAVGGGAMVDLGWRGVYLHLDVAAETHFMRLRNDAFSEAEWTAQLAVRGGLSLGKHF
jgi:Caspase domain